MVVNIKEAKEIAQCLEKEWSGEEWGKGKERIRKGEKEKQKKERSQSDEEIEILKKWGV